MKNFLLKLAGAVTAALACGLLHAEVIKPRGDLTLIKTAAGELAMLHTIVLMNNAHDVELLGFFKRNGSAPGEQIPFDFERGVEPLLKLRTGADCMVSGARVLKDGGRLRVVYAQRKGEWFDKKHVTFQVFELAVNEQDAPGIPPLYFRLQKTVESKAMYCDVNDALDKESARFQGGVR